MAKIGFQFDSFGLGMGGKDALLSVAQAKGNNCTLQTVEIMGVSKSVMKLMVKRASGLTTLLLSIFLIEIT